MIIKVFKEQNLKYWLQVIFQPNYRTWNEIFGYCPIVTLNNLFHTEIQQQFIN